MSTATNTLATTEGDELLVAMLAANRGLVALANQSIAAVVEDVTMPQYRVLSELAARGPQRVADLASVLTVERSTATRMCDRLVRKRLVRRRRVGGDRRGVRVTLTAAGRDLVAEVSRRRYEKLTLVLRGMPAEEQRMAIRALNSLAEATVEGPEVDWSIQWGLPTGLLTHFESPGGESS